MRKWMPTLATSLVIGEAKLQLGQTITATERIQRLWILTTARSPWISPETGLGRLSQLWSLKARDA